MAQPSSSHHHRDRSERSHHHHHRSISSTTLLLVLSLILAVLAVMLSLPSHQSPVSAPAPASPPLPSPEPSPVNSDSLWDYVTPKRSQGLAQRERDVAQREAEVARREAELLVGAPGGVIQSSPCPICPSVAVYEPVPPPPIQTVIKEIVKEAELTPPGWWDNARVRADDIFDRELKIAEREREISRREESVNRREHDASRRETWIMEQLVVLGNDGQVVEEEYVYDQPGSKRRPNKFEELPIPPLIVTEVETEYSTKTVTQTQHHTIIPSPVFGGAGQPANTRRAAVPTPVQMSASSSAFVPRTTSVEVVLEETIPLPPVVEVEELYEEEIPKRRRSTRPPQRWWGQ